MRAAHVAWGVPEVVVVMRCVRGCQVARKAADIDAARELDRKYVLRAMRASEREIRRAEKARVAHRQLEVGTSLATTCRRFCGTTAKNTHRN